MDEKELAQKVNAVLAEILTEASYIVAESEELITMNEAIQQAIFSGQDSRNNWMIFKAEMQQPCCHSPLKRKNTMLEKKWY